MKTSRMTRIGRACWLPVLFLLATAATALASQSGDFTCTTSGGKITITKYTGSGGAVTIPFAVDGKTVTTIGISAFSSCTSLTAITVDAGNFF